MRLDSREQVVVSLHGLILAALSVLAAEVQAPACRGLGLDTPPIVEVTAKRNRAPLAIYALGFSKTGALAWLEARQGFDSDSYNWLLSVVELNRDRPLAVREFLLRSANVQALCARYEKPIRRLLDKFGIERGAPVALEQPDPTRDPTGIDLVAGRRDRESHKTAYRVRMQGKDGSKFIGTTWRVDLDSGQPPVGPPKLMGILRSPFEARVAVLIVQTMTGDEGAEVATVKVFGGRTDQGWRPSE